MNLSYSGFDFSCLTSRTTITMPRVRSDKIPTDFIIYEVLRNSSFFESSLRTTAAQIIIMYFMYGVSFCFYLSAKLRFYNGISKKYFQVVEAEDAAVADAATFSRCQFLDIVFTQVRLHSAWLTQDSGKGHWLLRHVLYSIELWFIVLGLPKTGVFCRAVGAVRSLKSWWRRLSWR